MTTKQINCILELAKTQNFTRAAENLFVSQSAVTYQVKTVEDEVGFRIFERSGTGATLTAAGESFVSDLASLSGWLDQAIEKGQNIGSSYKATVRLSLPRRISLQLLPEAICRYEKKAPDIYVWSFIDPNLFADHFQNRDSDVMFSLKRVASGLNDIETFPIFTSGICAVMRHDDPLASKELIREQDLYDRTLLVGSKSAPSALALSRRLIAGGKITQRNCYDIDACLIGTAAGQGIFLTNSYLNDNSNQFKWIPFDTDIEDTAVLCVHAHERREPVMSFIETVKQVYSEIPLMPDGTLKGHNRSYCTVPCQ